MSEQRAEHSVDVQTPLELAGAEEGAAELERAIGKAKALGRNPDRLNRQLAKAREGMKRYRLAHPDAGPQARILEMSNRRLEEGKGACREETEKAARKKEKEREGPNGQSPPSARGSETAAAGWVPALGPGAPLPGGGTVVDGGILPGGGNGTNQDSRKEESEPDGAGPGEGSRKDLRMEKAGPATPAAAEAAAVCWDARAVGRAMEEMERQIMEEQERARAQFELSREQEQRVAAMELRLQKLENRGRLHREL
ncbi:MAG: hypothetical protein ABSG04_01510 [Verrucomicrobiota bacterium]